MVSRYANNNFVITNNIDVSNMVSVLIPSFVIEKNGEQASLSKIEYRPATLQVYLRSVYNKVIYFITTYVQSLNQNICKYVKANEYLVAALFNGREVEDTMKSLEEKLKQTSYTELSQLCLK